MPSDFGLSSVTDLEWDENNCEYLTNFFETAGGFFLEQGLSSHLKEVNDRANAEVDEAWMTNNLGTIHAKDEALTQAMAELL
jgi:hypothetical protein